MGSDRHYPDEAPSHAVTVDGFWIDPTPVTNAQFRAFARRAPACLESSGGTVPQIRPESGYNSACSGRQGAFSGVGHAPEEQKMKLHRRTVLSGTTAALAAPVLTAMPARADDKRQALVDSCLESARKVLGGKDFPDAAKMMPNARAVLIIPELVQGGFILGAAGGRGVLLVRTRPNDWSPPAFYGMGSGSLGLQIGAKVSEIVFIMRTEKGLNAILDHKFKFGAEAGITLVAVGVGVAGATTAAAGADIVAFSNSVGLFAGASIEGSYLDADNDWNALYYGPGATTKAIVLDRRFTKPGAEPIRQHLAKW
jgi:SH3 domain-containing YSC84-like protein 1